MSEKRRGLGRGIGALIPSTPEGGDATDAAGNTTAATATIARPVDVFFSGSGSGSAESGEEVPSGEAQERDAGGSGDSRSSARSLMEPGKKRTKAKSGASKSSSTTRSSTAKAVAPEKSAPSKPAGSKPAGSKSAGSKPAGSKSGESKAAAAQPAQEESPTQPAAPQTDEETDDSGLLPVPGATFAELPIDRIMPNPRQPREVFDEEELDELAASIREVGVLQPVVVRPVTEPTEDGAAYELIMGERRWRAARAANSASIPAVIRETSDADLLRDALLENLHRTNLNPLEEAAAYHQLLDDFGCTHDELATRIARSRPQISNTLRLMKLPPLVQRRVAAGVLSAGHARALLGLSDAAAMERLAQRVVAEGLSVRATEEIVALGDEPVAPEMRRRPRTNAHTEQLDRLAHRLSDRLDTRVKVNLGQRKGKIAIEFASVEDLNRILDSLAPDVDHVDAGTD